jgi:predicted RNA binding protein YcfA (HicA-like mRNA interferase family)
MPNSIELRKLIRILRKFGIIYLTGKGRHPKFYDPETRKSYPVKSHGKKTLILAYALEDIIKKFDLPADIFDPLTDEYPYPRCSPRPCVSARCPIPLCFLCLFAANLSKDIKACS